MYSEWAKIAESGAGKNKRKQEFMSEVMAAGPDYEGKFFGRIRELNEVEESIDEQVP